MGENVVQVKSYKFALRIARLFQYLVKEKKEFVLSKQILKSGTSIGANVEEGIAGQSKADFIAKLQIALKETRETHYWIRLLTDLESIDEKAGKSLLDDCEELLKLLTSILQTAKTSQKTK